MTMDGIEDVEAAKAERRARQPLQKVLLKVRFSGSPTLSLNHSTTFDMFRGILDVIQVDSVGEPRGELRTGACVRVAGHCMMYLAMRLLDNVMSCIRNCPIMHAQRERMVGRKTMTSLRARLSLLSTRCRSKITKDSVRQALSYLTRLTYHAIP